MKLQPGLRNPESKPVPNSSSGSLHKEKRKMKKIQYTRRGPVPQDVVEVVDFELPPLTAGQVLVRVSAAPINPSDVLTLTGQYALLPPLPAVGGNEGAGHVVEVGPGVENLRAGQAVLLPASSGTWTTHLVANAASLIALPDDSDMRQMSMLLINPPTALLMLTDYVDLKPGEWVIQNAANSAVGGYLAQIAHSRGLKTVNVVRRSSAQAAAMENGADVVLVDGDDLPMRVKQATGRARIRLGIDAVGGDATARLGQCLTDGATLLNYGVMSGQSISIPAGFLIFRDVTVRGFWLARWFRQASPQRQMEVFAELAQLVAAGTVRARIQASYKLEQIKQAITAAAAGERDGKILLEP
jgi:NADPH:quinone reductase-like Zn-dependent oxidoreductase